MLFTSFTAYNYQEFPPQGHFLVDIINFKNTAVMWNHDKNVLGCSHSNIKGQHWCILFFFKCTSEEVCFKLITHFLPSNLQTAYILLLQQKTYGNYLPTFAGKTLMKGTNIKNLIIFSYLHLKPFTGKSLILRK